MNLNFTPEENAFRQQVRDFVATALPADIRHKVVNGLILERDDYVRWQAALHARAGRIFVGQRIWRHRLVCGAEIYL